MRKLMILTAGVALLSASAALAQSSIEAPGEWRIVSRSSGHARLAPRTATTRAVPSRESGRNRSSDSCGLGVGPTIDHEPAAAVTAKSAASPPASGAVDQHGSPVTRCPPRGRL